MIEPKTIHALKRVADLCIEVAGDAPKNDLLELADKIGFTEEEIRRLYPELFESSEELPSEEGGEDEEEKLEDNEETEETEEEQN